MTARTSSYTYSHLEMEAALCVWEAMLEMRAADVVAFPLKDASDYFRSCLFLSRLWDDAGSVAMRHLSITVGRWCLQVYDMARGEEVFDGLAYDFEVIPKMLELIDWRKLYDSLRHLDYIASDFPTVVDAAATMRMWADNYSELH